ncbi:MAG: TPM domain-containing protein [Rhodospirillales bacterium]|nr:TPM domain-containing protein [Rhodospirillales bacterium]
MPFIAPPRRLPTLVCAVLLIVATVGAAIAAGLAFPALSGRVVDEAGLLTPAERQSLSEALKAHEDATGNQVVVVTLRSLQGTSIEDYGNQLARQWGIGRHGKDDGALLIVAPTERKVRIEVGYGLEGVLTDAASRLIIERIILPSFRSGQFGPGIVAGTQAILKLLSGDEATAPDRAAAAPAAKATRIAPPILMILAFLAFAWMTSRRRGTRAARGFGRHGPWIGGGIGGLGGGGFGGGSGSGGGFGGGGGGFGGGGASGGW